METHCLYFHAIVNIMQLEIEFESPLFDIRDKLEQFDSFYNAWVEDMYDEIVAP